jgi:hypothetical protein
MNRTTLHSWSLRAAAVFALVWSVFRAAHQAITLDEADTYLWFGGGQDAKFIWYPFPNNHVLNSLLIWLGTHVFGLSVLTVRLPALAGAAVYIAVAYFLCGVVSERPLLRLATFLCLVYNPFILDFFAAARGYSMANAFLLAALAIPVWHERTHRWSVARSAALASISIGLSFAANFSFALVDAAALLAVAVWAFRQRVTETIPRIGVACLFPALLLGAGLCGYPIAHYPRKELWYGATSLAQMTRSLRDASLYRIYRPLGDLQFVQLFGRFLLVALGILTVLRLAAGAAARELGRNLHTQVAAAAGGILAFALAGHYALFRFAAVPLPMTRTGIFFLPLITLLVAATAALPARSLVSRCVGHALASALVCLAAHYVLSLRYSYFREYGQQAEVDEVYRVMDHLNRRYGVRDFTADGAYRSSLNFYRLLEGTDDIPPLPGYPGMVPAGKDVYILHGWFHRPFIEENRLSIIYRGKISQVVVAVPPDGPVPPVPAASAKAGGSGDCY